MSGAAPELSDLQGLLRTGYGTLPYARFTGYTAGSAAGARQFIASVLPHVTPASARNVASAVQLATTADGLRSVGIGEDVIGGFSLEFIGGMAAPGRSHFLGDQGAQDPLTWYWGGPHCARLDLLVLSYADGADTLARTCATIDDFAAAGGLTVAAILNTEPLTDTEPFGFRDGISQPDVVGLVPQAGIGAPVPTGEFVLGYPNAYGELTQRPAVKASDDSAGLLPIDPATGGRDLGRNGSYLVVRSISQDVEGFWSYLDRVSADHNEAIRLGAKMVGRWPSGAPMVLTPHEDRPDLARENEFRFHAVDAAGHACPIGAHIRRANPRDSLDPRPGTDASVAVTNRHRLIRRGRKFGPASSESGDQGLHFVALNADLSRQFEFVQHSWLNSPKFGDLYEDNDPIAGAGSGSVFSEQALPIRRRYRDLPSFTTVRGGGYFFLPGLRALRYLAAERGR